MPFTKKRSTPYSVESDISRSSAERVAERMARVFRAAGLEAVVSRSRKSASHYVDVEKLDGEGEILDSVRIRISDHYLPDRHADLEAGIDYQVFTADMEALVETVRAALQRMRAPEPPELEAMARRSRAQRGVRRRVRTAGERLAEALRKAAQAAREAAARAEMREIDWHGDRYLQAWDPASGRVVATRIAPGRWRTQASVMHRGKLVGREETFDTGAEDAASIAMAAAEALEKAAKEEA